jgi:aminopeptidase
VLRRASPSSPSVGRTCRMALIEDDDRARGNVSAHHIDFMIGSAELDVDGVTADGERVSVLRNLAWQL